MEAFIQVTTERMLNDKWKPLIIGHVDAGTFFVEPDGGNQIWTSTLYMFEQIVK
jgi:hypothetical protein